MQVGILGSGDVAKALARGFLAHEHEVMLGTREQGKLAGFKAEHSNVQIGSFADAARFAEARGAGREGQRRPEGVVAGRDSESRAQDRHRRHQPDRGVPAVKGVLRFFTALDESLMERFSAPRRKCAS
jgi:hypothetical protein